MLLCITSTIIISFIINIEYSTSSALQFHLGCKRWRTTLWLGEDKLERSTAQPPEFRSQLSRGTETMSL